MTHRTPVVGPSCAPTRIRATVTATIASVYLAPAHVVAHVRSVEGRKQLRYAGVSIVFLPLGQVLIQLLGATVFAGGGGGETNWVAASVASAAILTVPNFYANKLVVWAHVSKDNLRTQILVFWLSAMLGVGLATGLTFAADWLIDGHGPLEKVAVFAAQIAGFGLVWIGRYVILDRWIFQVTHHGEEPDQDELDMLHGDLPI